LPHIQRFHKLRAKRDGPLFINSFRFLRRWVVMLCVAQCFVVCIQAKIALQDHIHHLLNIEHEPNAIAGTVVLTGDAVEPRIAAMHEYVNDGAVPRMRGAGHHHIGDGMMNPWLTAGYELPSVEYDTTVRPKVIPGRAVAVHKRQDRPPESILIV